NHPSASIIEVKKTINNNVTTGYNVDLSNGVDLIFEANGNIPAPTSVLPQTANTFLQTHFSNVNILRVERDSNDNDYDVYLANGYEVEFDYNGTWRDINGNNKALPTSVLALLPSKIESYRATNYPSTNITEVEKVYTNGTLSGYSIELSNGIDLVFDANGNLSNSNPSTPSTPQASLPQEANTFLQTHFAGVNISRIERDSDDNDYEVYLANGYELEFNSTGIWKDVNGGTNRPLPASVLALLPSGIENYRATNYPSTTIIEVEKNFTNGTLTGYNVDLSNGVDLIFNADGNFVRFDD
ncbi:MAG: PepSY-like domain-containing protein, partial [Bergeyella zoohelcum]|nr:PepSY-like domain-containing protein [Bergeyella zoohelcum]